MQTGDWLAASAGADLGMPADAEATLSLALLHLHAFQHGLVLPLLLLEGSKHHVIILVCRETARCEQ